MGLFRAGGYCSRGCLVHRLWLAGWIWTLEQLERFPFQLLFRVTIIVNEQFECCLNHVAMTETLMHDHAMKTKSQLAPKLMPSTLFAALLPIPDSLKKKANPSMRLQIKPVVSGLTHMAA